MTVLLGPALMLAGLLLLAGAQKVLDPVMTVGALRALGLPASPVLVRLGAAAEMALGALAVSIGGALLWGLVALSFVAFAAFVTVALRAGSMIGTCGCFGREDTPPHPLHVVVNVALAVVAATLAARVEGSPAAALSEEPASGAMLIALAVVGVYLLYAMYVELPRALSAARPSR